jgi:hypothetical protein
VSQGSPADPVDQWRSGALHRRWHPAAVATSPFKEGP